MEILFRSLTVLALAFYMVIGRSLFGTHANPIAVAVLPWIALLIGQQLVAPTLYFSGETAGLLCLAFGSFVAGTTMPARWVTKRAVPSFIATAVRNRRRLWDRGVAWCLVGFAGVNAGIFFFFAFVTGVATDSMGRVSTYNLVDAVQGSEYGLLQRSMNVLTYASGAVLTIDSIARQRVRLRLLVYLGIVLLQGVVLSSKLVSLICLSICLLTAIVLFQDRLRGISIWQLGTAVAAAGLAVAFFSFAMTQRAGFESFRRLDHAIVGVVGSPSVLSVYLDTNDGWRDGSWRGSLVRGPLEVLRRAERTRWPYPPVLVSPEIASESNIVTGLYQVFDDLGLQWGSVAMFIVGLATGALFVVFQRRPSFLVLGLLITSYMFLAWLPISAMTYYNYFYFLPVFVWVVAGFFFRIGRRSPFDSGRMQKDLAADRYAARTLLGLGNGIAQSRV